MDIATLIDKYQLNSTEIRILNYMDTNITNLKKIGVRKVAKENFVSTTTVINMCKKLGYSGYSELVFSLSKKISILNTSVDVDTEIKISFLSIIKKYAESPIMILGSGFSQNIANYFSEYLNLYGFRATCNSHLEFIRKSEKDKVLIIVISDSGDTARTVELISTARKNGIEVIAFTGNKNSKLEKLANLTICLDSGQMQRINVGEPNLFFGNALIQFELLMSNYLKSF